MNKILCSIEIFYKMRQDMLKKAGDKNPKLYCGLHSEGDIDLFELYVQFFEIEWLINHVKEFDKILQLKGAQLSTYEKKDMVQYFSGIYLKFIEDYGKKCGNLEIGIELLEEETEVLNEIIKLTDCADEKLRTIEVLQRKASEKYNRKIKELRRKIK